MTKPTFTAQRKNLGGLQTLLLRACPPDEWGKCSISHLAYLTGVGETSIYKWIEKFSIRYAYVLVLVRMNNAYWEGEKRAGRPVESDKIVEESDFIDYLNESEINVRRRTKGDFQRIGLSG